MPNRVVTHRARKSYDRTEKRREDTASGRGFSITTVKVGEDEVEVTVTVDLDAIIYRLGDRAWHNRSGRSRFLHGCVIVEARKI